MNAADWGTSILWTASNRRFGDWHGFKLGSLTGPTWGSPLVKVFLAFYYAVHLPLEFIFVTVCSSGNSTQWNGHFVWMHKTRPNRLNLSWVSSSSSNRTLKSRTFRLNSKLLGKLPHHILKTVSWRRFSNPVRMKKTVLISEEGNFLTTNRFHLVFPPNISYNYHDRLSQAW